MKLLTATLLFFAAVCSAQTKSAETGWYFLAEKAAGVILVPDIDSENVFAIETVPVLTKTDFKNVRIVTRDFEPEDQKAIEIHLTKDGRRKWNQAMKRISKTHESLVFVFNDKVYVEKFVYGNTKTLTAYIDLYTDEQYIGKIFNDLKNRETTLPATPHTD